MSAPLTFSSGAPVAQTECATGEFALRVNPAAHARATAPLPVAQAQQAGFTLRANPRQQRHAAMQQWRGKIMNAKPPRPRRQRKGDRLLSPDARREEIEVDHAVAPFDRMAHQMDAKWGIDRLPGLVTPELAARYGAAVSYLNECIAEADPAKTIEAVNNCLRGMQAMNAEAERLGAQPASGDYLEYEIPGEMADPPFRFGILKNGAEWKTAKAQRPDLEFYTLREVAIALRLKLKAPLIGEAKEAFPGAEVVRVKPTPLEIELDDEIPKF